MNRYSILVTLTLVLFLVTPNISLAGSRTFATPGSYSLNVPLDVTAMTATLVGGGGGGGGSDGGGDSRAGGGGGSGGYWTGLQVVSRGQPLTVMVGAGGLPASWVFNGNYRCSPSGTTGTKNGQNAFSSSYPYSEISSAAGTMIAGGGYGGGGNTSDNGDGYSGAGGSPNGVSGGLINNARNNYGITSGGSNGSGYGSGGSSNGTEPNVDTCPTGGGNGFVSLSWTPLTPGASLTVNGTHAHSGITVNVGASASFSWNPTNGVSHTGRYMAANFGGGTCSIATAWTTWTDINTGTFSSGSSGPYTVPASYAGCSITYEYDVSPSEGSVVTDTVTVNVPVPPAPPVPPPTFTFSRTPTTLYQGQSMTGSWSTTNATSLSYSCTGASNPFISQSVALSYPTTSKTWQALWTEGWHGQYACTWTVTGPGGTVSYPNDNFNIVPAGATASILVSKSTPINWSHNVAINVGDTVLYSWSSTPVSPPSGTTFRSIYTWTGCTNTSTNAVFPAFINTSSGGPASASYNSSFAGCTINLRYEVLNSGGSILASDSATVVVNNPSAPDLTAGSVSPTTATINTPTVFSGTISNIGNASTGASFSNFFQVAAAINGGGAITNLSPQTMNALATGGSASASSPAHTFSSAGTYSVRVCADLPPQPNGVITESNENNNCGAWTSVTVLTGCVATQGNSCTSAPNNCGDTNPGTTQCNGTCSATTPPNTTCGPGGGGGPTATLSCGQTRATSASECTINRDQSTNLYWSSTGAASCSAVGGVNWLPANSPPSGSVSSGALTSTQNYQTSCGGALSNIVNVTVRQPNATIGATPDRAPSGGPITVTWNAVVVNTCTITRNGEVWKTLTADASGTISGSAPDTITTQTTYRISCGNVAAASKIVNVVQNFREF